MAAFARVVVDLSLDREFDYRIPEELAETVRVGSRVEVPFGRRTAQGFVVGLLEESDVPGLKSIARVVGKKPLVEENILALARWMADYYCCPVEQAVRTVLPSAVRKPGARFKEQLFAELTEAAADPLVLAALQKKAASQARVIEALKKGGALTVQHVAEEAGVTAATVRALERKGLVRVGRQVINRSVSAHEAEILKAEPHALMPQQAEALALVKQSIETRQPPVVLLFGVTGSGKTEVYLQAIDHVLKQDGGCIVLVPEISLTPQTVDRFRSRFGDTVAVLHSELSDGERHDEWHRLHEGKARIAIGPRSAVFAPVRKLGLIVVDEEHEPSYKQEEAPRYHARDMAVLRGRMDGCAVVLGSATPALESLHNARTGKYAMVRMPHRVDHQKMPAMRVVDMRQELEREGKYFVLSRDLKEAIQSRLSRAEQTMLFLNRRGFATSLICPKCGTVAQCEHCSVAMTYHKPTDQLRCHICGASRTVPERCPNPECRDPSFKYSGVGTQRVEEVVQRVFPKARVQRMDSDTMTRKDAYRRALGDFRAGKTDILIGTQMIAKGLHFPNVTLVGVINADLSLHIPDFRGGERTFQLLTQVAGRAGRGDIVGEVIVQTFTPFHAAIQAARRLDYDGFFDQEIEFRRELQYPPFGHLVLVTLRGLKEELVQFSGQSFVRALQPRLGPEVILAGPTPAPLARAKGEYRYQIMIRAPAARAITGPLKDLQKTFTWPEDVAVAIDVDALSLL